MLLIMSFVDSFHVPRYARVPNIFVSLNLPNFSVLRRKLVLQHVQASFS